jgi:hypothetical protein
MSSPRSSPAQAARRPQSSSCRRDRPRARVFGRESPTAPEASLGLSQDGAKGLRSLRNADKNARYSNGGSSKLVLSNAERQKRHRERVKNKLSTLADNGRGDATNGGDDALKELLVGQFLAAGNDMLARISDEIREAARVEFLRTKLTILDIVEIMQEAGRGAALKIYEPLAYASLTDRRMGNAPPVAMGQKRSRKLRPRSGGPNDL